MNQTARIAFLTLATATLLGVAPAAAKEVVRSFRQRISVGAANRILLDFPVGEVQVEGWASRQVDLDVKITCDRPTSRCENAARELRLVYNGEKGQLAVKVKDWPHWGGARGLNVRATVRVPRDLALRANLGVGELTIQGTAGDLTADLGVGDVHVTLPKEAIGSARLDAGIGEAVLLAAGHRYESSGLIARKLSWDKGRGRSRVKVDCGVGEIQVTLA
ncbi:MAG TPA: hypothetical protein VGH73_16990 [Thermoanaerobaculia bacterium]|jgi:hypothetical protein